MKKKSIISEIGCWILILGIIVSLLIAYLLIYIFEMLPSQDFSLVTIFIWLCFYRTVLVERIELIVYESLSLRRNKHVEDKSIVIREFRIYSYIYCCILYIAVFWRVADFYKFLIAILCNVIWDLIVLSDKTHNRIISLVELCKNHIVVLNQNIRKCVLYSILLFVILLAAMHFYLAYDKAFQVDSENLVSSVVVARQLGLEINQKYFGLGNLTIEDKNEIEPIEIFNNPKLVSEGYSFRTYKSQVGVQGWILSVLSLKTDHKCLEKMRFVFCIFLSSIIMSIAWQIHRRYGDVMMMSFLIISISSKWIIDFSVNLYWAEFLWFIPIMLSLLLLNYPKYKKLIFVLYFISILIKCLCGYEYISSIMLGGVAFLIVDLLENKDSRTKKIKDLAIISTLSVLGFIVAFMIHASIYVPGNIIDGAMKIVKEIAGKRTYGSPIEYDEIFGESLRASVGVVLKRYLFMGTGIEVSFLSFLALACMMIEKRNRRLKILLFSCFFTIPTSWYILAKAHSYIHWHMNYVLWYLGYVQILIYIILDNIVYSNMHLKEI